ncbi:LysR family transcriptional regulator [Burkholderia cepacia]|uniref:helix-turn-helix domain-containing protein n=1 Tax=Burkholderia cepacia TaxID=292 RepID=UPI0026568905|nr:LysR family transcriptional regulator [Burkholderia cepacia]MDN7855908.1 LysR family transcriptional regulator [Burkholderia cepacia]
MTTIIGAAPSVIDTHVRLLEEATGVSLLERAPRGLRLTLTPAGKILPAPPAQDAAGMPAGRPRVPPPFDRDDEACCRRKRKHRDPEQVRYRRVVPSAIPTCRPIRDAAFRRDVLALARRERHGLLPAGVVLFPSAPG